MSSRFRIACLIVPILLSKPDQAVADVLDYLDQSGGCRTPLAQSFAREVMPGRDVAYGKPLAQWTPQDLSAFRAYYKTCESTVAATNSVHDMLSRRVDGYADRLATRIAHAHARINENSSMQSRDVITKLSIKTPSQSIYPGTTRPLNTDPQIDKSDRPTSDIWKSYQLSLLDSTLQQVDAKRSSEVVLIHVEDLLFKLQRIESDAKYQPPADHIKNSIDFLQAARVDLLKAIKINPPINDLQQLAILTMLAMNNPLKRDDFRASLDAGIDLTGLAAEIVQEQSSWLVRISGGEARLTAGNGLYCRVDKNDDSSLNVLKNMTPLEPVRFTGKIDEYVFETNPMNIRFVFGPCRVSVANANTGLKTLSVSYVLKRIANRINSDLDYINSNL